MNAKQLIGLIILSLGMVMVIFYFDGKWHSESKPDIITNSPISPTERIPDGGSVDVSDRSFESALWLLAGMAMVLVGGIVCIRYKSSF